MYLLYTSTSTYYILSLLLYSTPRSIVFHFSSSICYVLTLDLVGVQPELLQVHQVSQRRGDSAAELVVPQAGAGQQVTQQTENKPGRQQFRGNLLTSLG